MSEPRITLYTRASGRGRYSGLSGGVAAGMDPAAPADGPASRVATITFDARQIGGDPPAPGDRYCDSTGQWWTVQSIGAGNARVYSCLCQKVG